MNSTVFRLELERMAGQVGMALSADLTQALETYFDVLALWNRRMNLTAFQLDAPSEAAIERLFLEPLQAAAALRRPVGAMIDVGSGGGSPAIPLCLVLSPARVTLVESRSRKSVFLKEAARKLGLASPSSIPIPGEGRMMAQRNRGTVRQPATKFAQLRKKLEQRKARSRPRRKGKK